MKDITDFLDIHTHDLAAGQDALINLPLGAQLPEQGYYSVGIHPWDTDTVTDADIARVAELAADDRVVAIGEVGLDALKGAPMDRQETVFRAMAQLSERLGKPLIIHAVKTLQRLIELRIELRPTQRWVIHGYRGKPQMAQSLLRAGFDLSFGERFNPASAAIVPPGRRFAETDTSPMPISQIIAMLPDNSGTISQ